MTDFHDMAAHRKLDDLQRQINEGLKTGGGGPYDGDVNARVTALETRLDTILPMLATKGDIAEVRSDMHKGYSDTVKWIVGVGFTGLAVLISVMTLLSRQPQPAAQSAATQAPPIIINVPSPAAPPTQAAPAQKR